MGEAWMTCPNGNATSGRRLTAPRLSSSVSIPGSQEINIVLAEMLRSTTWDRQKRVRKVGNINRRSTNGPIILGANKLKVTKTELLGA